MAKGPEGNTFKCEKSPSLGCGITTDFYVCVDIYFFLYGPNFSQGNLIAWKSFSTAWQTAAQAESLQTVSTQEAWGPGPLPGRAGEAGSDQTKSPSCPAHRSVLATGMEALLPSAYLSGTSGEIKGAKSTSFFERSGSKSRCRMKRFLPLAVNKGDLKENVTLASSMFPLLLVMIIRWTLARPASIAATAGKLPI